MGAERGGEYRPASTLPAPAGVALASSMIRDTAVGLRFARSWLSGRADVAVREIVVDRGDRSVPATLLLPARPGRAPLPGWILLHGAAVPGRAHPQLVRFAKSLAHTGVAVLLPEVPEWKALQLAPELTVPTVRASVPALHAVSTVAQGPVGLVGFSFGAPHAVAAGGDPSLAGALGGIAAFGGYVDLPRMLRFLFLGEHEWEGRRMRSEPDPYGRWIVGGNYLHRTPGYEDAEDVARALLALATEAGVLGAPSLDPVYDPTKRRLAEGIAPARRALFDLFAPTDGRAPERASVVALLPPLEAAIRRLDPALDPVERLRRVRVPVRLMHGHGDVLIPYTETLRMGAAMGPDADVGVTIRPGVALPRDSESAAFATPMSRSSATTMRVGSGTRYTKRAPVECSSPSSRTIRTRAGEGDTSPSASADQPPYAARIRSRIAGESVANVVSTPSTGRRTTCASLIGRRPGLRGCASWAIWSVGRGGR